MRRLSPPYKLEILFDSVLPDPMYQMEWRGAKLKNCETASNSALFLTLVIRSGYLGDQLVVEFSGANTRLIGDCSDPGILHYEYPVDVVWDSVGEVESGKLRHSG